MSKKDLVMLVPDGAYREVLPALLRRARSLSMREIDFHVVFDPFHDSSPQAVELLRPYQRTHRHGIVFRDFEGSGREKVSNPEQLEERLERELIATGWTAGTAHAVVAVPELEDWLRVPSPHFAARLEVVARRRRQDLTGKLTGLVEEYIEHHGGHTDYGKPRRPKEVFEAVLEHFGVQYSNAHYRYLAERESLRRCTSPSFLRLVAILQNWFQWEPGL